MATDVLDEHRFKSQTSLYESARTRIPKNTSRHTLTGSTATIYSTASTNPNVRPRRVKYSTQSSVPTNTVNNSIHHRNSVSNDIISLFRSFTMRPFRTTTTMTNAAAEGQTNNIISGNNTHSKPPVSLIKYRPISDNITDYTSSHTDSTRVCILERLLSFLNRKLRKFDGSTLYSINLETRL